VAAGSHRAAVFASHLKINSPAFPAIWDCQIPLTA
jgi:hypothetical protein